MCWIQALYAAGLSSKAIVDLFPSAPAGRTYASVVNRLVVERYRVDAQVRELTYTRDRLDALIVGATDPNKDCEPPAGATA